LRHGHKLGQSGVFFHRLVADLVAQMGEAYPELAAQQTRVEQVLRQEEERFSETLENGMRIMELALAELPAGQSLDGHTLFTLYDTYGFPVDLTADICRERKVDVDLDGFERAMAHQREQARAAGKFKAAAELSYDGVPTRFDGYEQLDGRGTVTALYVDGTSVPSIAQGQDAVIVLDATPFYAESGGQVGDTGMLASPQARFQVADTQKIQHDVFGHHGRLLEGTVSVGDVLDTHVDHAQRRATMRNHSATHLMHKALRQVLGGHVQQRGSLVDADKTRFDFSHDAAMDAGQIADVERIVNGEVLANEPVSTQHMSYDEAVQGGAVALFGEKYGDVVRVLDIGFSRELCGGTHVARTGDIGLFKIVSEGGVAAGIRRIEAITGVNAVNWVQRTEATLAQAAGMLKAQPAELPERIHALQQQMRQVERELERLRDKQAAAAGNDLAGEAIDMGGVKLLVRRLGGVDPKALRGMVDQLKAKLSSAVILLAAVTDDRVSLVAGVSNELTSRVKAGELVAAVATQIGGKGGGRPDMAMGGGSDVGALDGAVAGVRAWVQARLEG
jgi:alanyl-tRNA synthetase